MAYMLHGGDIYHKKITYDFSVNVNPLGIPPGVQQILRDSVGHWDSYPDPECRQLRRKLAGHHGVEEERIACGNGAADLIYRLAFGIRPRKALLPSPTFSEYGRALSAVGCQVRHYGLREEENFRVDVGELARFLEEGDILFLYNPNNPTGQAVPNRQVAQLLQACRDKQVFCVLDECFCEFLDRPDTYTFMGNIRDWPEAVILRAFTKSYALAGLRLGYAVCGDPGVAGKLRQTGQPWSVSLPAQEAGVAALEEKDYLEQVRSLLRREREYVGDGLTKLGFCVFPSQANYLLFKDVEEDSHGNLWEQLREKGILIRDCSNFAGLGSSGSGLPGKDPAFRYYRTAIRTREENEKLLDAVRMAVQGKNEKERNPVI